MPTRHLLPSFRPLIPSQPTHNNNIIINFKNRILIPQKKTRELLRKFVTAQPTKLTHLDWNLLIAKLTNQLPSLVALLHHLLLQQPNHNNLPHYHFAGI